MPSGGRSELNEVVLVILLASSEKEKAHELEDSTAKLQHLSPRLHTLRSGLATRKGARGGSWPELGKKGSTGSFKGLERGVRGPGSSWVMGKADTVHWGDGKGVSTVNFTVARV